MNMLTENEKTLIKLLAAIGIREDVAIGASCGLDDCQLDEFIEFVIERHEEGNDVTEEDVVKAHLILLREAGKI